MFYTEIPRPPGRREQEALVMKRLFFPAERPLDGRCPSCGGTLVYVTVVELIDTALSARPENLREVPRWMCRRCWLDEAARPHPIDARVDTGEVA